MLKFLSDKILDIKRGLSSKASIRQEDIDDAIKMLRIGLLSADVSIEAVKLFTDNIKKAIEIDKVINNMKPVEYIFSHIFQELVFIIEGSEKDNGLTVHANKINKYLIVGMQGAGKTTTVVKLANKFQKEGSKTLVVSLDTRRAAAYEQLQEGCHKNKVDFLEISGDSPIDICKAALNSQLSEYAVVIFDSAGRMDENSKDMEELYALKDAINPVETIMVADALMGQDSMRYIKSFHSQISLSGLIMTRVDSDDRGGAILSMRIGSNVPIKALCTGEQVNDIENMDAQVVVRRILKQENIADILSSASSSLESIAEDYSEEDFKGQNNLEDFMKHLTKLNSMLSGSGSGMLNKLMGMSGMNLNMDNNKVQGSVKKNIAIIQSMTKRERKNPKLLNASRKIRIAKGSGALVRDINQLLKQYQATNNAAKMMKNKKGIFGKGNVNPKDFSKMFTQ